MNRRIDQLMERLHSRMDLEPIVLDPNLAAPQTQGRGMKIRSYNWKAERFSKISVMDTSVSVPPMDQLNSMFYPRPDYDFPIFLFLVVVTKSNVIAIFNVNCPFQDPAYTATYVDPLTSILKQYPPFTGRNRYPDWFEKYRTDATIFGVFAKDELDSLTECGLTFLETYLERVSSASIVKEPDRLERIARFHEQFKKDIRDKDRGRGVLAKLTDEETARRIFYEVAT